MQMLERYLHAIEFWLPRKQRRDIIAEISEDLNSQVEDKESALGRRLNDLELEDLIKRRGSPVLVANRYLPQQSLIGPIWFPAYVLALKMAGLCCVPWLTVFVIVKRIQQPAMSWSATALEAAGTIWTVAFVAAGVITIIFALLQFAETRTHFLENWNPRELPAVQDPYKIPLATSITEIIINLAFILWWLAYASSPVLFDGPNFKLSLAPVQVYFFWGYLALAFFNVGLAAANLWRRYWSVWRATGRLLSDLGGGALFCWLMKANIVATLYMANVDAERTLAIKNGIHFWMDRCFPIAVIVAAVVVTVDVMRIVRMSKKGRPILTSGVTALLAIVLMMPHS